jgi:tetratricopeptide (TPR) repeat protein
LGLIYQQRRQFDEAKARFTRAIEIDATEADPAFQLGRIAIEEGQPAEAITWLRKAAALNDKCCSHEVWRELGVAYLQSGQLTEAHEALEKYVSRRPYDPAGLYWQGKTLVALARLEEARESLRGCEESVSTMPPHLRRQHGKWKSLASAELRRIEKMKSTSWAKPQSRAASSGAAIDNLD